MVGRVDEEGSLSGAKVAMLGTQGSPPQIAYIYPDFKTALYGTFKDGVLVSAQASTVIGSMTDYGCIKVMEHQEDQAAVFLGAGAHILRPHRRLLREGTVHLRARDEHAHAEGSL